MKLRATPAEVHLYSREGALLASHARRERGSGAKLLNPEHYQGVPGAESAFDTLRKLEEMGLSPFCVEKRDLAVYEEVAGGDTR